uniref:Uncharacterized protein n=1 Tax=Kalanchoe fedtschenkoi TaxID=63787 RepID=A0A7N0UEK8_KALFE
MEMEQLLGKTVNGPGHTLSSGIFTSYDAASDSHHGTYQLADLLDQHRPADAAMIQSKPRHRGRTAKSGRPHHRGTPDSGDVDCEGSERRECGSRFVDNCASAAAVRSVEGLEESRDSVFEVPVDYGSVERRKFGFDLNLAADDSLDDLPVEPRGRFDLNLGCDQLMDVAVDSAQDHYLTGDCSTGGVGEAAKFKKVKIGSPIGNSVLPEVAREGEEHGFSREINTKSSLTVSNARDISSHEDRLKEASSPDVTLANDHHTKYSGAYQSGTRGRRKRKASDTVTPISEPALRRSARKTGAAFSGSTVTSVYMFDSTDQNLSKRKAASLLHVIDMSSSNVAPNFTEQGSPCEEFEDINPPPIKLQLPESSQNLNLDGISMLDLISIYSFIRSFSTILFLSPFQLEDFCAALKCKSPTSLFDQTHVALLQTLRKHLQFLSSEGSRPASDCLRSLNWDFLDPITWPLFIAEYLLIMKPDFDLRRLNLTGIEYYKQPESLKVDVLRILCDDLVDTECIRAEINRRSLVDEHEADPGVTIIRDSKRRRANMDLCNDSNLTGEVMDEAKDWNSDECCLCKVDGSLICCDGCPAAYHARCVGVTSDLLPEGEWYCPECNMDRDKSWKKHRVSLRGAESLGVDPDGRMYFGSCDCLLVLDSHEDKSAISYYCRNDLDAVIQVLKSSDIRYSGILNAISQHWGISVHQTEKKTGLSSRNLMVLMSEEDFLHSHQPLESSEVCSDRVAIADGRNEEDICNTNIVRDHMKMVYQITSSEGSADTSHVQATMILQSSENSRGDLSEGPAGVSNPKPELPENLTSVRVPLMNDTLHMKVEQNSDSPAHAYPSGVFNIVPRNPSKDQKVIYSNYYSLAQVASSVAEDLFGKCSKKTNKQFLKSNEGSVSSQLKAIIKKCSRFCWYSIRHLKFNARTEKCGWCYCCKVPDVDMDCLFKLYYSCPARKNLESQAIDHPSKWVGKGHLVDIIYYVLFIESRLQGLLLGPWLNPQHSAKWSRSILRSSDLASVKDALLLLESNLHHLVFSVEWSNDMDSAHTLGSASYAVTSSSCLGLKHGVSRKRGRSQHADSELLPTSNAANDLDFFWWRGGRASRRLFNWKVLPHSLASKAARLAGGHKIPGIYYPEASEFAKRRKNSVWRAAVENSSSVEQIAYLIRELDSNIKWDDIENTNPFTKIDKKLTKACRLFKKVIIRRKKLEGTLVKYLLDFGKRRVIPEIVVTHGYIFEESASERKKYWLEESLVPMHMMKSFEENRICRKNYKMKSGKLVDVKLKKGCYRPRDFSYLFSRAEKSENCECGHCKKSVPIRESVRCQFCEDYFHKRHVRRFKEKDLAGDKYSCFKCHQDNRTKVETKKDSVRTLRSKGKKVTVTSKPVPQGKIRKCSRVAAATKSLGNEAVMQIPLRRSSRKMKFKFAPVKRKKRSPRKTKLVPVCKQKAAGRKRGRSAMAKKTKPRKVEDITPRKKRTQVHHSYWLNGLNLVKKPDDQRVVKFRREKLHVPSEDLNVILNQPVCTICSKFTSQLIYICCEVCEDWFHGRAFGVDADNVNYIIGFRCHSCCKRNPPVCPVLLERNLDGTGVLNKNKYSSGKGRSPSLEQLNVESLGDCLLYDPISEVVSNERESAMWNPDQIHHSEASPRTEIEGTADGTVSDPHIDMERVLPTEIREHHTEKGCAALVKIYSLSPDPASTAETNLGKLGQCDRVAETGASGVPESSEIL